jgi:hypothetical protein
LQNEANDDHENDGDRLAALQTILPAEILMRSGAFPIMPSTHTSIHVENIRLRDLFWYLPEPAKAQEICQTYYRLGAWMSVHFSFIVVKILI